MLKKLKARLQSLKTEREEAKQREERALRGKDAVRCQAFWSWMWEVSSSRFLQEHKFT